MLFIKCCALVPFQHYIFCCLLISRHMSSIIVSSESEWLSKQKPFIYVLLTFLLGIYPVIVHQGGISHDQPAAGKGTRRRRNMMRRAFYILVTQYPLKTPRSEPFLLKGCTLCKKCIKNRYCIFFCGSLKETKHHASSNIIKEQYNSSQVLFSRLSVCGGESFYYCYGLRNMRRRMNTLT